MADSLLFLDVAMEMWPADGCKLCYDGVPIDKRVGKWKEFLTEKAAGSDDFSAWCREQLAV